MQPHRRRISCFGWCVIIMLAIIVFLWGRIFLLEFVLPDRHAPHCLSVQKLPYRFTGGFTNGGRLDFIAQFGWEVDPDPLFYEKVAVPKQFDTVWHSYNAIQLRTGTDLRRYAGKSLVHYAYRVQNHPSGDPHVRLNLYTYGNKIVAADVQSTALGGFMHAIDESGKDEVHDTTG